MWHKSEEFVRRPNKVTIQTLLKLKSGDQIRVNGTLHSVLSSQIMPKFESPTDRNQNLIDLSYFELIHTGGSVYSGPPVRMSLDLQEIE